MAPENRQPPAPVKPPPVPRLLEERIETFDFFQAVRILEWQARCEAAGGPAPRLGADTDPAAEPVRFRASTGLVFPTSAVTALATPTSADDRGVAAGPAEMTVAFMGLTGPSGMLPLHYTDRVLREMKAKNPALRDFLDLFNHRLVSLFYRAWAKYRLPVQFERDGVGEDPVTTIIAALVGLGSPSLRRRLAANDLSVFHFGATYARQVPSAASLEALLSAHFGLDVEVRSFQARWIRLAPSDRTALRPPGFEAGCYARLGVDAIAGEMVLDAGGSFRLRIGPMLYSTFTGFIPGGAALREIIDLVRLHVGPEFDFDIQCVIRDVEVPACRLDGEEGIRPRLGWNCWLACDKRETDADDPVFLSEAGT